MQVLQPTVVDSSAFQVWKDEAFELWTSVWGSIYPSSSASRKVIAGIAAPTTTCTWWTTTSSTATSSRRSSIFSMPTPTQAPRCIVECIAFETRVSRTAAVGCLCAKVLRTLCTSVPHARTHNDTSHLSNRWSRTPHKGHPSSTFARSLTPDARKRAPVLCPLADARDFPPAIGNRASLGRGAWSG